MSCSCSTFQLIDALWTLSIIVCTGSLRILKPKLSFWVFVIIRIHSIIRLMRSTIRAVLSHNSDTPPESEASQLHLKNTSRSNRHWPRPICRRSIRSSRQLAKTICRCRTKDVQLHWPRLHPQLRWDS